MEDISFSTLLLQVQSVGNQLENRGRLEHRLFTFFLDACAFATCFVRSPRSLLCALHCTPYPGHVLDPAIDTGWFLVPCSLFNSVIVVFC